MSSRRGPSFLQVLRLLALCVYQAAVTPSTAKFDTRDGITGHLDDRAITHDQHDDGTLTSFCAEHHVMFMSISVHDWHDHLL